MSATGTEVRWSGADGKPVKSVPAAVKRDHKEDHAAFVQLAKDVEKARAGQARRLEDSWLEARSWSYADWRQHYLGHALRGPLVESLIWRASWADRTADFLPKEGEPRGLEGEAVTLPDDARITLWHPLDADLELALPGPLHHLAVGIRQ